MTIMCNDLDTAFLPRQKGGLAEVNKPFIFQCLIFFSFRFKKTLISSLEKLLPLWSFAPDSCHGDRKRIISTLHGLNFVNYLKKT